MSRPVYYYYPAGKKVSFAFVAEQYIKALMGRVDLVLRGEDTFYTDNISDVHTAIIHPYFYIAMKNMPEFIDRVKRIKIAVGVDVADTDTIAPAYVALANFARALIVPSEWSRQAYIRSGIGVPVHIVPHGVEDAFFQPPRLPENPTLRALLAEKRMKELKYIYFHLWHSGFRKGADIACKAVGIVQRWIPNAVLIIKTMEAVDPYMECLRQLKHIVIQGYLDVNELAALYDMMDVTIMPSRGGSFELVALESLIRGVPALVPAEGPWTEYIPPVLKPKLTVRVCNYVKVLPGNPIHVGYGPEACVEDYAIAIYDALMNIEELKAEVRAQRQFFERYRWPVVGEAFWNTVKQYIVAQ